MSDDEFSPVSISLLLGKKTEAISLERLERMVRFLRSREHRVKVHVLGAEEGTDDALGEEGLEERLGVPCRSGWPTPEEAALWVVFGGPALLAVGEEDRMIPLWFDLSGLGPFLEASEPSEGHVYDFWNQVARALDRGDGYSVATSEEAVQLRHQLGLRGRFVDSESAQNAVLVLGSNKDKGWERWQAWLEEPKKLRRLFQLPGSGERQLRTWLEDSVREIQSIQSSRMWRLWMLIIAIKTPLLRWIPKRSQRSAIPSSTAPSPEAPPPAASAKRRSFRSALGRMAAWPLAPFRILLHWIRHGLRSLALGGYRALAKGVTTLRLWSWVACTEVVALGRRWLGRSVEIPPSPAVDGEHRPRVLIVSPYPIYPANHGGAVRLFNLVKQLGATCSVHLLVFLRDQDEDEVQREALEAFCESVHFHRWEPEFETPLWDLAPPNARLFWSSRAELRIRDLVERHRIEILQLEYTELAQYRRAAGPGVQVILVEHDVAFRSFRRRRGLDFHHRYPDSRAFGASALDSVRLERYEIRACREVDQIHVMSEEDGAFLSAYLSDRTQRIRLVPNAVDTEYYRPAQEETRRGVLFVGNFENLPNLDAFEYFTSEIWPRLRQRMPEAEVSVVGAKMPDSIRAWDGRDGIRIVGTVPDMRPYYHRHRLLACPIRAGSGTRLKLLEAYAAGIPAVATRLAAEGIEGQDGEHLLVADDPESFVEAMERLLRDEELAASIATAAMGLAVERYDWSASAENNRRGFHELLGDVTAPEQVSQGASQQDGAAKAVEVSVIIPTLNGGRLLERTLESIQQQETDRSYEVVCVDSGSRAEDLAVMEDFGARIHGIRKQDFNHGLTRDLGASLARGEFLLFLNQDAVPGDAHWLEGLVSALEKNSDWAAVQGGILEFPEDQPEVRRFFWDSCGERFYFTRESDRWIQRFDGIGFSTVNAAMRRSVWQEIPFGWAPIMEDKKWQREVMEAGYGIGAAPQASVFHTHDYDLGSLGRRCRSEGYGWRLLGEDYHLSDMLRDLAQPRLWKEVLSGLRRGRIRGVAEVVFPWFRPWMLWVGNRWSQQVEH